MFLPFLPFIFILTTLAVMTGLQGQSPPPWEPWEAALAALLLLLPALGLNLLPERLAGSRSAMRLSRRRLGLVVLWLALLETVGGAAKLKAMLSGGVAGGVAGGAAGAQEWSLLLLLGHYWLADALCLEPFPTTRSDFLPFLGRLIRTMGIAFPMVAMIGLGSGLSALGEALLTGNGGEASPLVLLLLGMGVYLGLGVVLLPALIPVCWGLRPLAHQGAEAIIREELQANGVRVHRILDWPGGMAGHATAGVIGLLPRFRYLLVSPLLARDLEPDELRSVTAHEAAHLKHGHLWFFFLAFLAFMLALNLLFQGLLLSGIWLDFPPPPWALIILEIGLLLLFIRFGIGFLSRRFERQADENALTRQGAEPFARAMLKVAHWNGIAIEEDNWHHYGIARRLAYAREAVGDRAVMLGHNAMVFRVKLACVAALVLALTAQGVFSATGVVPYLADTFWIARLEQVAEPSQAEKGGLLYLATQAYQKEKFEAAERYFRLLLQWSPEEPSAQNNLAWLLVSRPSDDPGRTAEGLRLALQAVEHSEAAYIWDTLAEAHFRSGALPSAREAARRALALAEQGKGKGGTTLGYYRSRFRTFGGPPADDSATGTAAPGGTLH